MFGVVDGAAEPLPQWIVHDGAKAIAVSTSDVKVEGTYTIRVTSTLDDTAATAAYTEFLLVVDDGCEADVVSLVTGIADFTYDVDDAAVLVTKAAVFSQSVGGCDLLYSINVKDGASPDPNFITIDPTTGVVSFETADPQFFDVTQDLVVRCENLKSGSFANAEFRLYSRDFCFGATLTAPTFTGDPEPTDVWSSSTFDFEAATDSIGACGAFTYSVNGLDESLYTVDGTSIEFSPDALTFVSDHDFTVTATLTDYDVLDATSEPKTLTVTNPCLDT